MHRKLEEAPIGAFRHAARDAPMLDPDTERDYLRRIHERRDAQALEALVAAHERLVVAIASRYVRAGLAPADLVAEGRLGLIEAVHRFDRERGVRFSTYASWWIRSRVRAYALDNRRIVAQPSTRGARKLLARIGEVERELTQDSGGPPARDDIAASSGASVTDVELVHAALSARDAALACEHGSGVDLVTAEPAVDEEIAARELARVWHERIVDALDHLDQRERTVIHERFLGDEPRPPQAIGHELGISRERVRQIEKGAVTKLRDALDALLREELV